MTFPVARFARQFVCITTLGLCALAYADDNPYAINYQKQNQGNVHSLQAGVEPQLFVGKQRKEDNTSMLENGYDMMGFSSFEAGDIPSEQALAHARQIQADTVLVYVKKAGNQSPAMTMEVIKEAVKKGKSLTEKDVAPEPGKYRYFASYWAKLPPPVLGIHVIKLVPKKDLDEEDSTEANTDAEGVRVIAVIHGSAAERAGVQRHDQLLSINQEQVKDAAGLSTLVQRYKGNTVQLQLRRQGAPLTLEAIL